MAEYAKIETAMVIISDLCGSLYPDGYSQEKCGLGKCDWMEYLKETAADVAPVVHGWWKKVRKSRSTWECSVCGTKVGAFFAGCSQYCYCCGAQMGGITE